MSLNMNCFTVYSKWKSNDIFPFLGNMTSKKLRILRQSVQCSNGLFYCVIKDDLKLVSFFKHDVKETKDFETISPMFKWAAVWDNWNWNWFHGKFFLCNLTSVNKKHHRQSVQCSIYPFQWKIEHNLKFVASL